MGKASGQKSYQPFGGGSSTSHPASTIDNDERNQEYIGQFTQVLSNRALNEVRGGYSHYGFANNTLVTWSKHWQAPRVTNGYPRITLTGFCGQRERERAAASRPEGLADPRRLYDVI